MTTSLAPRYQDLAALDAPGGPVGDSLVITDLEDIAVAAASLGAECWYAGPATEDEAGLGQELRRRVGRHTTVVVAWGDGPSGATPEYGRATRFARTCLALLQALRESGRRIHLVTLSRAADVLPSLLDGMALSAALECPLTHTAVEYADPATADRLRAWIAAGARYPGARLRAADDRIARLDHAPLPQEDQRPREVFGPGDRVVLIGGAGGIGRHLCRYLSERCGAQVFILGRGTPGREALEALKEAGARSYVSVAAHDPDALDGALRYLHEQFGPLAAVFNLAGVLDDCLLYHLTPDRLENVLRPKAAIGLNLAALSGPHRPGMVVHFSSLTSVMGNVGQVAYGAANAFLDRLTAHRPDWYSINWGLWETDGMRMPTPDDGSGLRAMPPEQACDALMSALGAGTRRLAIYDGQLRLAPAPRSPIPDLLTDTTRWLRELIARHSGLRHLRDDDNLLDQGVDSVGSIRISRDIEARLGIAGTSRLSRAVLFEYPTVAALGEHLAENFPAELESFLTREPPEAREPTPKTAAPPTPAPGPVAPAPAAPTPASEAPTTPAAPVPPTSAAPAPPAHAAPGTPGTHASEAPAAFAPPTSEPAAPAASVPPGSVAPASAVPGTHAPEIPAASAPATTSAGPTTPAARASAARAVPTAPEAPAPAAPAAPGPVAPASEAPATPAAPAPPAHPAPGTLGTHAPATPAPVAPASETPVPATPGSAVPASGAPAGPTAPVAPAPAGTAAPESVAPAPAVSAPPGSAPPASVAPALPAPGTPGTHTPEAPAASAPATLAGPTAPEAPATTGPVESAAPANPVAALADEGTVPDGAYRPGDIAIVGMAGEFPGGADTGAFWRALLDGDDAVRVIPGDRWDWRGQHSFSPDEAGTSYGRHGGFLDHALDFDPVFFNITPIEAQYMDPQERRFLQCVHHALEDSGYFARPTDDVGVFVAAMFGHYQDLTAPDRVIGSSFAAIANRVSYAFDLHGPSVALDTMCSGGLTALHLAVRSIRAGDCALAVAGGVNLMTHPGKYRLLSEGTFLSPTGHCQAFGVEADGYVPGEGTVAVVLKPLSEALRDGDRVHAVIRATAVNAGGRTAGFTVPSERAQHRVIASALAAADIEPSAVTYVEAHGTGTRLGDPIEVRALGRAYGGPEQGRAYLGSVKSNIGHLESAAAMAGLVKVVKQLTHRTLAPTLHCELENPDLHLDDSRFALVKEARPWPRGSAPTRFAGLSSFGAGGANGHAIIQEFVAPRESRPAPAFPRYFIPLSGRDEAAVRRRADDLLTALRNAPDTSLYGLSYTLCCARQHFRVRRGYWAESVEQLTTLLQSTAGTSPAAPPDDDPWARTASAYLDGENPGFTELFPVRMLVDAPLYPFATDRYVAAALDHANRPTAPATADDAPGELLLTPVWRQHTVDGPAADSPVRRVLVLTDHGQEHPLPRPPEPTRLIRVVPGHALAIEADRIELPEDDDAAAARVLRHLTDELGLDHLYWVDLRRKTTVASALSFARALQACRTPSTILGVTREADTAEVRSLVGFLHGLAEENPHIRTVLARRTGSDAALADGWRPLLDELSAARQPFTEVRWSNGTRETRELTEIQRGDGIRMRTGGTYLLTGGLGAVGRAIAERLIERYGATVIAVGRSAPDAGRQRWIAASPELHYEQADITAPDQTRDLIAGVRERFGGLDGVIHSAGVIRDALVRNKSAEDAAAVLAPKVRGTQNLDRYTADLRLDFFCAFSSISSVMGNTGQSDYIAANRFLDEFAAERARRVTDGERSGLTLSVNWPLWLDAEDERRERYEPLAQYLRGQFGMEPLSSRRGADLFVDLLNGLPEACHQVIPCVGDVERMRERLLPGTAPKADGTGPARPAPATAALEDIGDRLMELVRTQTGLRPADITFDSTWGDLGYSSVMLQGLARELGPEFGVETPPNALFKYSSITSLSAYLRDQGVPEKVTSTAAAIPEARHDRGKYAIVGMSGIMPGGADLTDFWRLLVENRSAIRTVDRWKDQAKDLTKDPSKDQANEYFAGTIDGYDTFDHGFFGLSAREAMLMDPQHRLFLQCAYNALLDSGHAPATLRDVGVFAGVQFSEYQAALYNGADWAHPYTVTGNAHTMLANRVSHLLDFTGPSQTVDTACSSGLVALNRGVLSLAAGECDVALVGAVSVLVDPAATDAASGLGVLSPDFRCATFDQEANGYVRAEGVGCVVVKRLDDAQRDGDAVLAVVEAVAENHDGRSNSLTAPNPEAQTALLRKAYTPELAARITHIETHGTGTNLGDPIEISALRAAFGTLAPHREPGSITLGAVKTNVGHLEPAAGMAGLLKLLLCLRHRHLPANINFKELNPLVELDGSPFRLLLENERWERGTPLVTGVSSFGFGGSNAHVVLSEAPTTPPPRRASRPYWLITLSARSTGSLAAMRDTLLEWLRDPETEREDLADIAHTLTAGRDHFEYRMAWIASSTADLLRQLEEARPEEVAKCGRNRPTAHPVALPDAADPGHRAALEAVRARYLEGEEFVWPTMFEDGQYRRLRLPGYAFARNRFWFE
ncbi:SDR family NAD(P)-dependent oxidoreductase [Streptomyces sp. NPDC059850]|uniref:SDR family NAD(P)-dependent oxidoreductase n=1 Tax=Streptomyces sp. NPDC059850 TaxID=3346970 RepID=UPI00364CF8DD